MAERKLTVDDIKHRAEEVRDLAVRDARRATQTDSAKLLMIGVAGVLAIASFAYYLGSRKCSVCGPTDV